MCVLLLSLNKVKISDHQTETKVIYLKMARWHKLFFNAGNIPDLNIQKENVSQKNLFKRLRDSCKELESKFHSLEPNLEILLNALPDVVILHLKAKCQ